MNAADLCETAVVLYQFHVKMNSRMHMKKGDGMTTYTFRVVVEPDEDRWRAYSPALEAQGASTWGYTKDEAIQNIWEVLEMITAELVEEGKAVPSDGEASEEPLVAVTL